jgi:uncharacterized protein YuzE
MKVTYDPEIDVQRILCSNVPIEESDEDKPGVIIDYDKDGNIVGEELPEYQNLIIHLAPHMLLWSYKDKQQGYD